MRRFVTRQPVWTVLAALSLLVLPGAWAQEAAEEGDDKLPEIIVTAQKREQNLQDVGTSVTAFDGAALEQLGLKNVTDIAGQVPGLQYNQYGATVTIYNLRGVSQNDFSDHQEAPVAVYADDAYIASTGALAGALFDLQRVEVLRGPQGTLFGRNATGGLIQYVSAPLHRLEDRSPRHLPRQPGQNSDDPPLNRLAVYARVGVLALNLEDGIVPTLL